MTQTHLIRDYKYWAFISYSHEDKDVCNWLHPALEKYVIPKELRRDGGLPKRLFPIFRDNDEMAAAPEYSAEIDKRLSQSLYLIVICSPNSAKSKYVNSEIKAFKTIGRSNNIIPLIVGGTPNVTESSTQNADECFPEALRFDVNSDGSYASERANPIGPDLRFGNDSKQRALLKIVAPIIGVELEELEQRDKKQRIRNQIATAAGAVVFAALLLALTVGAYKYYNKLLEENAANAVGLMRKGHQARDNRDWFKALSFYRDSLDLMDLHGSRIGAVISYNRLPKELAVLRGAHFPVRCLAISQDGHTIVSGEAAESIFGHMFATPTIHKWDLKTGKELFSPPAHEFGVVDLSITPAGDILVIGNENKLHKLNHKLEEIAFTSNDEHSLPIVISHAGGIYAALNEAQGISIWDQESGKELTSLTDHSSDISILAFSPSGKYLAAVDGNTTHIWDWEQGTREVELPNLYKTITHIIFSPTERTIALGGYGSTLLWYWQYPDEGPLNLTQPSFVSALSFSPDGKTLATGAEDGTIYLWSSDQDRHRTQIRGHEDGVTALSFTPDGKKLISGGEDSTIRIWKLPENHFPSQSSLGTSAYALALSPDNETYATWKGDQPIRIIKRGSGKVLVELIDFDGDIQALAFSHDGLTLAASTETDIYLWNLKNGNKSTINTGEDSVDTLAFSPDGKTIAAGSIDKIQLWDRSTLKKYGMFNGVYTAYSKSGHLISPAEERYSPMILEEHEAQEIGPLTDDGLVISAIAFNPDGETIALSDITGKILFWSKDYAVTPKPILDHKGYVPTVAFSPDGSIIASGGEDHTIRLWNWRSHEELAVFTRHECTVDALAFSPDGKRLLAVGENNIVYQWDLGLDIDLPSMKEKIDTILRLSTSLQVDSFYDVEARISCDVLQERLHAARTNSIPWLEDGGEALKAGLIQQFQRQRCDEQNLWQSGSPKPSD